MCHLNLFRQSQQKSQGFYHPTLQKNVSKKVNDQVILCVIYDHLIKI